MADITNKKLASMTTLLMQRTMSGAILWEATSTNGTYATRLGEYTFHLSKQRGQGGQPDYYLTLFNGRGDKIDSFSDVTLRGIAAGDGYDGYFELMGDMYTLAGRQSTGADKAIDDILGLLK